MEVKVLVEKIIKHIKDSKSKLLNVTDVTPMLKEILGDTYSSETGIAVKESLSSSDKITLYKEGYYFHDSKSYYVDESYYMYNGAYKTIVEGIYKNNLVKYEE